MPFDIDSLESANVSVHCNSDSGGPVFLGNPREIGAKLQLIGVLSSLFAVPSRDPQVVVPEEVSNCVKVTGLFVSFAHARAAICKLFKDEIGACP
jgi:hypothetical protein